MLEATSTVVTVLALLVIGQVATVGLLVWYVRRTSRRLGDAVAVVDARVGRVGARVRRVEAAERSMERSIKALAVRIRDNEVETGVDALNRYMLLASHRGGDHD